MLTEGDNIFYYQARNRLTKEIRVAQNNYSEKLKKELSANYLFSSLFVFCITLIICCLQYVYTSVLEAPNTKTNYLCVQTHLAIKLFLIYIYIYIYI